jgi:predicted peptidase
MGAAGAWRVAALDPDRFAALAMSAPKGVLEAPLAAKLKHVFSYVAAPQNDKPAYEAYCRTVEALGKARAEVQARVATNNVKECYQWFYSDNSNYDWINQKKRRTADERRQRDEKDAKELADAFASIPRTPGEHRLKFVTWVGDKKLEIPYQLCLPRGYDASPSPWPAVMFLSGAGEMNPDLSAINSHGPVAHMHEDPKFKEWFPFIVISPIHDNSPERARGLVELIEFLEKAARIDPDRVYATGLSLGGTTTWTVACAGPDKFAAIVPINGRQRCEDVAAQALKYVTSWIIVGGADGDFYTGSCKMNEILTAAGTDVHLTVIPGEGHGSWPRYYTDRRFYDWLLQHRRLTAPERAERDRHPVPAAAQALAKAEQFHEVLQPGHHWLEFAAQLGGKPYNLRYALYLPRGYDPATANKWPMMLFLHGDEQRSTDQSLIFDWGSDVDPRRVERSRPGFPMIGLAPQLPQDRQWSDPEVMKMTLALVDEVGRRVRVDADRVYITGMQNGGTGAWALAMEDPARFAALFPYQAAVVKPEEAAKKLKQVAAKAMAPKDDGGAVNNAKQMVEAMKKGGATAVELAVVPQAQDANAWLPYYTEPQLVGWLMQHRRGK